MNDIANVRMVVQPTGDLTAIFTLNGNAVAFAIRLAGQRILTNFLMGETFRLQPDAQILAWLVFGRVPSQPPVLLAFSL